MRGTIRWFLVIAIAAIIGCGKTYDGEKRFAISGKVTVDGQPLDQGLITFMPQGGTDGAGRVTGNPIRDGIYAIPEETGPTASTYKVIIYWNKRTGKKVKNPMDTEGLTDELIQGLPDKYNKNSELSAEVSEEKTTFDFNLTTN